MFLTKEEWRHPNQVVQALARPAVAWTCFSVDGIQLNLLIEIKHFDADRHAESEWLMAGQLEALVAYLTEAEERVGAVYVLVPAHLHTKGSWQLEQVTTVRRWDAGTQSGLECQVEGGTWYSPFLRPDDANCSRIWFLAGPPRNS